MGPAQNPKDQPGQSQTHPQAKPVRARHNYRACASLGGGKFIEYRLNRSGAAELSGFLGRRAHGVHESPAHRAAFEFVQPIDGGAARAGHHIL